VNRNFRLRQSNDFKRVRRFGKSYAHPFIVLVALRAEAEGTRIGVAAGKSVGNAVQRNKAKRLVREAVRSLLPQIQPGWNIILICRKPMIKSNFIKIQAALLELFSKAKLLTQDYE
jgi:ribonuclease P protein component